MICFDYHIHGLAVFCLTRKKIWLKNAKQISAEIKVSRFFILLFFLFYAIKVRLMLINAMKRALIID